MEVRADRSFVSKETTTKREKRSEVWPWERPGWAAMGSQWERHLPPNGSSGMWGSVGRTHRSRASSLQPREGLSQGVGVTQGPRASCDSALGPNPEGGSGEGEGSL